MVVALNRVGQQIQHGVHEHQRAQTADGRAAEHGEQAQLPDTGVQALDHFGVGEVIAFEEPIHQLLVGLGNGFLQGIVKLGDDGFLALGDLDFHSLELLHLVGALVQHVNDADDPLGFVPNGNHHRGDLVAVLFPQGVKGGVVVGIVLVYLGNVDKAGHIALFAILPGLLKANGNAVLGRQHQNGGIGGTEGFHHGAGEVEGTRGVQDVDLGVLVFQGNHGSGD